MASTDLNEASTNDGEDEYATADDEPTPSEPPSPKKRKADDVDGEHPESAARLSKLRDVVEESLSKSNKQAMNIQCDQPEMMNYKNVRRSQRSSLRPILLMEPDPNKVPQALRRLDPETKIDIFNRKTGKILTGQDAVRIKNLSHALMRHAEYEPIVPTGLTAENKANVNSTSPSKPDAREGRSAPNVRVSRTVAPQRTRPVVTKRKGEVVTVTDGPYCGYVGEIDSRTPGGWYILSNVRTENDKLAFPLVVEPEHLKAVSMNDSKVKSTEGNKEGQDAMCADDVIKFYKSCVTSQNSELTTSLRDRIQELVKEEISISREIENSRSQGQDGSVTNAYSRLSHVREQKDSAQKELNMALEQTGVIDQGTSIEL